MRGANDVRMAKQRIVGGRLLDEHVEGRARDMAAIEQGAQRRLIDQAAARAIDDSNALLGLGEIRSREDVLRLRRHWRVNADEVGAREKIVEFDLFDAEVERPLRRKKRIVSDDVHVKADRARRRRSSRYCRIR